MAITAARFDRGTPELRKAGKVVGLTDRIYEIKAPSALFDEVVVKGDLSGDLEYNGKRLRIVRVDTVIGLKVTPAGAVGPVWEKVECEVA